MKYLKITNQGTLNVELIPLMGGTTKKGQTDKIGQFGTGLKYAMAYSIREGADFLLHTGGDFVEIASIEKDIDGNKFDVICINAKETSITAQMGYDWEPWMVVREIYSNALDEGGESVEIVKDIENDSVPEGHTAIYLELTADIMAVYNNWTRYFIHDLEPLWTNGHYSVYPNNGPVRLYKQGVLVKEIPEAKGVFMYESNNCALNELRQYIGSISSQMVYALAEMDAGSVEYFLEHLDEEIHYEADMDYQWFIKFNDAWKQAIGDAKIIHTEALAVIKDRDANIDTSGLFKVPKALYDALVGQFDGIGALRVSSKVNEFFEVVSEKTERKLNEARAILEKCGYYIEPELSFVFGVFGSKKTLAQVDQDSKTVYISEKMGDASLFQFVAMLIEENEHFKTGHNDCTRAFQQHFIDLYTGALLELNEVKL